MYIVFYISLGKDINDFLIGLYKGIFALNFFHQIGLGCIEIVISGDGQGKP